MTTTMAASQRAAVARDQSINSVADIIRDRLPTFGTRPAIRYDDGSTYRTLDFMDYVGNIGRALQVMEADQERQQVICTFVMNRPEWDMLALASLYTGNILFPLDTKMHDEELAHLLKQSPPDLVLVSPASRARMKSVLRQLGIASHILIADLYRVFEDRDAPTIGRLDDHERRLSSVPVSTRAEFPPPSARLERADLVLGHYATSGTTSLPKLVRITHGNIVAQVNEGMDVMNLRKAEDVLNIGPYTHIATLLEFLVTKVKGFSVTYFTREADEDTVLEDEIKKLKRLGVRIKALMAVPKFWIYIMKEVLEEMAVPGGPGNRGAAGRGAANPVAGSGGVCPVASGYHAAVVDGEDLPAEAETGADADAQDQVRPGVGATGSRFLPLTGGTGPEGQRLAPHRGGGVAEGRQPLRVIR